MVCISYATIYMGPSVIKIIIGICQSLDKEVKTIMVNMPTHTTMT